MVFSLPINNEEEGKRRRKKGIGVDFAEDFPNPLRPSPRVETRIVLDSSFVGPRSPNA